MDKRSEKNFTHLRNQAAKNFMEHPEVKEHSTLIRLVFAIAGLLVFIGVEADA